MRTEYFIANRIASASGGNKPSVMVRVAAIGVALSLAVMIITLAVIFGFDSSLRGNLMAIDSHVTLRDYRGAASGSSPLIKHNDEVVEAIKSTPGYLRYNSYAVQGVIFRHDGNVEGAQLRGVDSLFDWRLYNNERLRGELPRIQREGEARSRDILISESLAQRLNIDIGGRLEVLYTTSGESMSRDLYQVCGVYSTGIEESDKVTAICDITSLGRTMNWEQGSITGYQVTLDSDEIVDDYAFALNMALIEIGDESIDNIITYTFEELNPSIIGWLSTHNVNGSVIIVIMVIVAAFNMASALLIMVLERRKMVGVLKSLGMSNRALSRLFIIRSLYIILSGVVWGNIMGLTLSFIQQRWQPITLDSEGYLLSAIPIDLSAGWVLLLNVAVVAAILLLISLPARFVTRIEPCEAIK